MSVLVVVKTITAVILFVRIYKQLCCTMFIWNIHDKKSNGMTSRNLQKYYARLKQQYRISTVINTTLKTTA